MDGDETVRLPQRSMGLRQALAEEAMRRRIAGESPAEICAALKINKSTYWRWARMLGFRLRDLEPADPMARGREEAGTPASWTGSGRYMRGEGLGRPRSGGRVARGTMAQRALWASDPAAALIAVEGALAAGDMELALAVMRARKVRAQLDREVAALRELARPQRKHVKDMTPEEARRELARVLGIELKEDG